MEALAFNYPHIFSFITGVIAGFTLNPYFLKGLYQLYTHFKRDKESVKDMQIQTLKDERDNLIKIVDKTKQELAQKQAQIQRLREKLRQTKIELRESKKTYQDSMPQRRYTHIWRI